MILLLTLMSGLACSPAWAAPNKGSLVGWGWNAYGQADVPAGGDFVGIAGGGYHGLALSSDGSLRGWGANVPEAANVPAGNDFVAIAGGLYHSLALRTAVRWSAGPHLTGNERPWHGRAIAAGTAHSLR
jgi:alpha-tubulin suppressor-like RCC1 family protein